MQDFRGKAAFITGGASGIGLGMARAFAAEGMRVMIADVEEPALAAALDGFKGGNFDVRGVFCDVADAAAMERAAAEAFAAFGKVHILCNNAGVSRNGPLDKITLGDWEWVLGVNLKGAVNGLAAFLPHIKAHGEGGHIVNTASIAGMRGSALAAPYCASKAAIVGLTESLAAELAGSNIGASVLCPGAVLTRMQQAGRNRPERLGGPFDGSKDPLAAARFAMLRANAAASGLTPDAVAQLVLAAIRSNALYIFTHAEHRRELQDRFDRITAAFDAVPRRH